MIKKKWNIKKISEEKKEKKIPFRFKIYLFLFFLCFVGIVYVLRLPEYQIKSVSVKNNVLTKESEITEITDKYRSQKYFYLVPQSNVWLYPKSKIEEELLKLPSIDGVEINIEDNNSLSITLKERKHEFVWCDPTNQCFYMNGSGFIFARSPNFEGNVFLVFRGLITDDPLGKDFLPKDIMANLINFIGLLSKIDLKVSSIEVLSLNEVNLVLNEKGAIIISLNQNLEEIYNNIKILASSSDFINATGGGIEKVKYIDMRYGKKAFWKEKEGGGMNN